MNTGTEGDRNRCGATYSTVQGRVFRCEAPAHPRRPDAHYYVRDHQAEVARALKNSQKPRGSALITTPGERRG